MNMPKMPDRLESVTPNPFSSGSKGMLSFFKKDRGVRGVAAFGKGVASGAVGTGRIAKALTKKAMSTRGGRAMGQGLTVGSRAAGQGWKVASNATRRVTSSRFAKAAGAAGRIGLKSGSLGVGIAAIGLGAVAMLGVGIMKGAHNASREIVAERAIQDQRYARNITMMSRLGYTTGTNRLQRYGHTVGLSQALSANRHGRGAY